MDAKEKTFLPLRPVAAVVLPGKQRPGRDLFLRDQQGLKTAGAVGGTRILA